MRFLRARVAIATGDGDVALGLLDGLEAAMPLLAADVEHMRAQANVAAGRFAAAGEWFAARGTAAMQIEAARAFDKAGDPHRARVAADRIVVADRKTRAQEGEARAIRVRVAGGGGESERADARWLATQGADLPTSTDALALLTKLDPTHPLTAREWMLRARALADAGRTDDALRAADSAATAPRLDELARGERAHTRAMILFRTRGRWLEAAKALTACAVAGGPDAADSAFHAARALSRADHDQEAIAGYEDVQRRFPKSIWAEQAAFFAPYLRMLHGEWKECARGFDAYVRAHPAGEQVREARGDGALCKLLEGDAKAARLEFERLVEDEPDPIASARLADMAALAALRDGDRTHALMRWTDVVRSRPLSWPALVAAARLREVGAPVPPSFDPPDSFAPGAAVSEQAPLSVDLPPPANVLHELGLELDAEMALRERESAISSAAGARGPEALCIAYGRLDRARRRYQLAQLLPSALLLSAPSSRTRWAWECAFPTPYSDAIRDAESREGLPTGLLWAVMRQESGFDPEAISPARAVGLMQLLPETARSVAEELGLPSDDARLFSPAYSIRVGARTLRKLLDEFDGNIPLAVAAYNGGAESIERWISRSPGMQLDTFVERIPYKETREYVAKVMGNLARYGYVLGGEHGVLTIGLGL
jgi:soluble lytic murein transglycosylase